MIAVRVETLGNGRVMLQVGDDWHLVLLPHDAVEVAQAMTAAAHGSVDITAMVEELHCPDCGHVHAGVELGQICIGCPCLSVPATGYDQVKVDLPPHPITVSEFPPVGNST